MTRKRRVNKTRKGGLKNNQNTKSLKATIKASGVSSAEVKKGISLKLINQNLKLLFILLCIFTILGTAIFVKGYNKKNKILTIANYTGLGDLPEKDNSHLVLSKITTPTPTNTEKTNYSPFPILTPTITPITRINLTSQLNLRRDFSTLQLPILMYHHIRNYNNKNDTLGTNLSVSPAIFEKQLSEVKRLGYHSVKFQDLTNYIYSNTPLPKKPIIISFDDGYDDAFSNALPLLQKYNMIGSFAIITSYPGRSGFMNWSQIKQLKSDNNEIVSHTVKHVDLQIVSKTQLKTELKDSKVVLDTQLNQNTETIVYPSGEYNAEVEEMAIKVGYKLGRTTKYGTEITRDNLLSLPTIRMANNSEIS